MESTSEEPVFKNLDWQNPVHEQCKRRFAPTAHDVYDLSPGGELRIAKCPSARQITKLLARSNGELATIHDAEMDYISPLIVIRFEVDEEDPPEEAPPQAAPTQSSDDWSQLWGCFDSCYNQEDNAIDFVARIRQADAHCHSSFSKNSILSPLHAIECSKSSYSVHFLGKHILITHHFHKINDEVKEMVRIVTCGYSQEYLERILRKALLFLDMKSSESDGGSPSGVVPPKSIPHPRAILCAMLECSEKWCGDELENSLKEIKETEDYIKLMRDPATSISKGLEISSLRLNDTSIQLGVVRQKLQHLLSSIASLEHMGGPPSGCKGSAPMRDVHSVERGSPDTPEGRHFHQWLHQLEQVKARLMGLKKKSEQHNVNIENLQERIKGNFSSVSILLAERENEWSHKAMNKQHETSKYQVEMMKFQVRMLGAQELIASRTKRDNTVMKVIAVLTSLFLPGAYIATLFSVPVFNWNEEDPRGPHFMTYWYFTGPITATLVIGFSAWFVKMWFDDKREAKRQAEEALKMDPEKGLGVGISESSLESHHLNGSESGSAVRI